MSQLSVTATAPPPPRPISRRDGGQFVAEVEQTGTVVLSYLFDWGKAEAVEAFASTHHAPAFPTWIVRAGAYGVVEEVVVVQRGPRWPECGFTGIGVASA